MRIPLDVPAAVGREVIDLGPEVAAGVLRILEAGWGYATQCADVHRSAEEPVITERLRGGMRIAIRSNRFRWARTVIIAPGTESVSAASQVLPDGRTDIPLYFFELRFNFEAHDPHAIIECKRIAGSSADLCRQYVVEGVDRFRAGKYGADHAIGFMAGYVVAGDAPSAAVGINAFLTRHRRGTERLVASNLVPPAWAWRSSHPRPPPRQPIDLHHALLVVERPAPRGPAARHSRRRGRRPG